MQFHSHFKNRTDRYMSTNYPVSCSAVLGKQYKFLKFRGYVSTWYCVCTTAMFILKGSYGCGEPKMRFSRQCKNRTDRYRSTNYPVSCSAVLGKQYKFLKFRGYVSTWYCVCTTAMFILKGSYGCGEPKMRFSRQCKNRTDRYRSTNYPVSCSAVLGKQ